MRKRPNMKGVPQSARIWSAPVLWRFGFPAMSRRVESPKQKRQRTAALQDALVLKVDSRHLPPTLSLKISLLLPREHAPPADSVKLR